MESMVDHQKCSVGCVTLTVYHALVEVDSASDFNDEMFQLKQ